MRKIGSRVGLRSPKAGMSLVELAIAVVVVIIGFSGLFGISSQMSRMVCEAREDTRTIEAAQHVMEIVKTYSWVRLNLMMGTSEFDVTDNVAFSDLPNSSCTVTIESVAGEVDQLRRVIVFVTWQNSRGTMVSRELISLISRKRRLI